MAATGSPSHSPPNQNDGVQHSQNDDPNPTPPQQPEQSQPEEPPHNETLDLQNSPQSSGIQNSQQSDKNEDDITDDLLILDDDVQQSQQNDDNQSGTIHTVNTTLPEPIILPDNNENLPPVTSPANAQRRANNKRKKAGTRKTYKRKGPTKKMQNLTDNINPRPFVPRKKLDLDKYEDVLKRLGLYEFSKIEFDRSVRTDLIVQLIVNYDSKKRKSYVDGVIVKVNRADLARALKLPAAKQDKGSSGVEEVDLDSEVFSDEAITFIEDFVFKWLVLHDESLVMPTEIMNWTRCIRDGHPEKLDFASLIWYNVEKELSQGDKLVDCYYVSHLQYLIRSQKESLFKDNDDNDVGAVADYGEENVKGDEEQEEKYEQEERDEKDEKEEKEEAEEEEEEKVTVVQEHNFELNLGADFEEIEHEEVKKDDEMMADAEESKEDMEEQGSFKSILGDHFLQRCQSSHLNNFEEIQVEDVEVEDEQIEQVEDEDEEEEVAERVDEGFEMEANDDEFDRDGLTDNFLQGVETSHNPYNSHGMSSMDLFGSRDGSFMSHGGPSFYNNGGKRLMDPEEDIQHLDQNNKRLKTDEIWDEKQNDIGFCFEQMQQLMQKAKMIHESKERSYEDLQYNQQMAMEQLQGRQQILEMHIKLKDEELEKKHSEVFRLERELYLMGDLLAGYRKALNDTRFKFSEYRKRVPLQEEPLYKDAGPGGLVLSTREIEKQRLKQEEDMKKFQILAKNIEEECVYQLEVQNDRLLPMADKLTCIKNELQSLKEIATRPKETREPSAELDLQPEETHEPSAELNVQPKETHEPSAELDVQLKETHEPSAELDVQLKETHEPSAELDVQLKETHEPSAELDVSVEPEKSQVSLDGIELSVEVQKSQDEIPENDATMEIVPTDADESKEKGGGEEH